LTNPRGPFITIPPRLGTRQVIESILLTAANVVTFDAQRRLTNASGFFFERDQRLFLVTSRHVLMDAPTKHFPDRIEIELHTNPRNLAESTGFSIPLYREGRAIWRQGSDDAGQIDVTVIELDRGALPQSTVYRAFTPEHLLQEPDRVEVGMTLLVVGFPLGFHDTLHHMPVVRQAIIASSFGLRFQGQGYFLTDARMHRGTSGAPVVMRATETDNPPGDLPWKLLGVHSARLDIDTRDLKLDEALGLNCAWYADILLTLTED
jgi:S1-C subfamily serine protease